MSHPPEVSCHQGCGWDDFQVYAVESRQWKRGYVRTIELMLWLLQSREWKRAAVRLLMLQLLQLRVKHHCFACFALVALMQTGLSCQQRFSFFAWDEEPQVVPLGDTHLVEM